MSGLVVFVDTETTSLRPDRRAWEIGLIERRPIIVKHPDGPDEAATEDVEHRWFIGATDLALGNADPMALQVGQFHQRHPEYRAHGERHLDAGGELVGELEALRAVERVTRGAHLVGAVVSFDAEVLAARMRAHNLCPSWNYHLIDVEALAAGWLAGYAAQVEGVVGPKRAADLRAIAVPPWDSHELSRAVGVEPGEFARHEALGDARWARAIYDAVMDGPR